MKHKITNSLKEMEKARKKLCILQYAKAEEVRKRYKVLAKKWHPDINKAKNAKSMIRKINNAFEIIMKEEFDVLDPWEDYEKWWQKQFGNDPIWGNSCAEEYRKPRKYGGIRNDRYKLPHKRTEKDIVREFLDKDNIFAVVGVSKNPKKYGNKVYGELRGAEYSVFPVNPNVDYIEEEKCYPSLSKLPKLPDVINMVVPPKISKKVVKEAIKLGIKKIWLQPGSESQKTIDYCKKHNVSVLHDRCIMIERRLKAKNGG